MVFFMKLEVRFFNYDIYVLKCFLNYNLCFNIKLFY